MNLLSSDDTLADALLGHAKAEHEGLWRLPLHPPYKTLLRAEWGQIKNVGSREAGAATAALFLQHFVAEDKSWAHVDIAGNAFLEKSNRYYASGGTGEIVRTLASWIESLA
ncbi:MAG: hypothetical protein JRI25_10450 [Deltaproteobacteria bacterium]|nr:hypothetical protein [Deltaproteobacteria bacterium]